MNRSRFLFFLLSVALLVPIVSATLLGAVSASQEKEDSLYKYLAVFSEVLSLIRRTYVEPTEVETLFAGALDGTTDALDALSTYVPAAATATFREALEVGESRSGLWIAKERGFAFVLAAEEGGPGAAAGLHTGDLLASLNEVSTRDMPLWQIRTLFAGPPGTEIAVEYLRRGLPESTQVTLGPFDRPQPALVTREGVGILTLPRVGDPAVAQVRRLLEEMVEAGSSRLIVDLRGSAGGDPAAAYRIADLFVAPGRLGELREAEATVEVFDSEAEPLWRGRLAVLTDRGTQGASEIVAA
ncbi:MAG: S41 family peptidase, partial [Thermoanaerobaculia bacterium]|nr:S41 family peptidase [Thermoanaerobaculia bacterium]